MPEDDKDSLNDQGLDTAAADPKNNDVTSSETPADTEADSTPAEPVDSSKAGSSAAEPSDSPSSSEPKPPNDQAETNISPAEASDTPEASTNLSADTSEATTTPIQSKQPKQKKSWLIPVLAAAGVAILVAAFVGFKAYTSSPNYVWNKSLSNTSDGYHKLTTALQGMSGQDYKNFDIKSDFKLEATGMTLSGDWTAAIGEKDSEGSLNFKLNTSEGGSSVSVAAGLDVKVIAGDKYPDIYVRARDLDKIASLLTKNGVSKKQANNLIVPYNNQWYEVKGAEIEQMLGPLANTGDGSAKVEAPKPEDVTKFMNSLNSSVDSYLFSDDSGKAVIQKKDFVDKEKTGSTELYHYTATINKGNFKAFAEQLEKTYVNSDLGKWQAKQTGSSAEKSFNLKDLKSSIDNIKDDYTFDVWVDGSTKMISKLRFSDQANTKTYFEIGAPYVSGSEIPFSLTVHDDSSKSDFKLTASLDSKTSQVKLGLSVDSNDGTKLNFNLSGTPSNEVKKVERPNSAKNLQQLMSAIQGTSSIFGAPTAKPTSPSLSPGLDSGFDSGRLFNM